MLERFHINASTRNMISGPGTIRDWIWMGRNKMVSFNGISASKYMFFVFPGTRDQNISSYSAKVKNVFSKRFLILGEV